MKTRNAKKTSTVIITLAVTVILVTAIIITMILLMKKPKQEQFGNQGGTTEQVANTGNFHENGWDASIVAEIKDGVPVPQGFQYVSGDKKSGLIVQNMTNGKMYVWIPYLESTANEEAKRTRINEFFKEKENIAINPDKLAEIQKYGGFYAGIDYLDLGIVDSQSENENGETLPNETKTYAIALMNQNEYEQAGTQAAQANANEVAVDGSVMGKEELSMILDFTKEQFQKTDGLKISTSLIEDIGSTQGRQEILDIPQVPSVAEVAYSKWIGRTVYAAKETANPTKAYPNNKMRGTEAISLSQGVPLKVLDIQYNSSQLWLSIAKCKCYNNKIYYIYISDLTLDKPANVSRTYFMGGITRYAKENSVSLYENYGANPPVTKSVAIGSSVTMYSKFEFLGTTWVEVSQDGTRGYMRYEELTNQKVWEEITGDKTRYIIDDTSMYASPEKRVRYRTAILELTKGTSVIATHKATIDGVTWAKVRKNGKTGYVLANKLGTANPNESNGGGGNQNTNTTTPTNPTPPPTQPTNTTTNTNTTPTTNTTTENPTTPEDPSTPEEPIKIPAYTGEVITVKPGEIKQVETPVPDKWKNTVATIINGVPVPKGFEVATYYGPADENTGFVIRQISSKEAENFHRLCYVWVPVNKNGNIIESLEDAKRALNEAYTKAGLNTQTSESAVESLPNELVKSVKEYGGFYIAMGELGYDNNGKFYNRPRGMTESDTNKGWYGVDYGNYFRYIPEGYWNQTTPVNYVAAAATYDNIMKDFTLDKMNKVCEMLSTESVTSHLTYGAEWDAAMLWILKRDASTSEDLTSLLLKDSSSIGKYRGSMFNAKMLNCTWGFAGNLAEVTQEKVDGKIVVRGGSYATLGSEQPIASRTAIEENEIRKGNQYGFRNCIYINLTEGTTEPASELQALIDSGKATTERITTVADKEGNKIAIPQGFKVTKDAYHVNEGVVIENAQGDQFVWVPVANVDEMYNANEQSGRLYNITKDGSNLKVITSINDKYFEPGIVTGGTGRDIDANVDNLKILELDSTDKLERQMKTEFNAMINSVKTHGGFYIARYETGNVEQEYPSVKQNAQNRTNLNWYQAYMKNQKIPTGNYGISGTIYGCQWDMALRWLQSCDASNQKVNHIGDLANGTAEWTMEAYANDARVVRDVTREESTVVQAGTRMDYSPNETKAQIGTRAMMYIR